MCLYVCAMEYFTFSSFLLFLFVFAKHSASRCLSWCEWFSEHERMPPQRGLCKSGTALLLTLLCKAWTSACCCCLQFCEQVNRIVLAFSFLPLCRNNPGQCMHVRQDKQCGRRNWGLGDISSCQMLPAKFVKAAFTFPTWANRFHWCTLAQSRRKLLKVITIEVLTDFWTTTWRVNFRGLCLTLLFCVEVLSQVSVQCSICVLLLFIFCVLRKPFLSCLPFEEKNLFELRSDSHYGEQILKCVLSWFRASCTFLIVLGISVHHT